LAPTNTHAHPLTNATTVGNLAPTESVDVVVTLKPRNRAQLDSLVAGLTKPGSSTFRQYLTHEEALAQFSPTQQQAQTVASYLSLLGFTDVQIADNRMLVSAKGTPDAVKRSFNTTLAHFSRNGQDAIANITDVQVPSQLQDTVEAVLGLQTLDQAHLGVVTPHDPVQFQTIYDAAALPAASNTTVAILTEGSMTQTIADLHTFESRNGLPTIYPTVVTVGGTSTDTSGTVEWDMDSQDIQAMAGGHLAGMIFYDSVGWSDAQMTATYNKIVSDDLAKVINVSLEKCEVYPHADGAMASDDVIFELAIAQGQTFSIASGDWGSKECGSGINGYSFGTVAGESYPASSPYVIAVGGTTLSTNTNNTYLGETGWTFSGGGPSLYEPQPYWQAGIVPGSTRAVPDIAFDADVNSGAEFISGGVLTINGGTSLASPLFVGSWCRVQHSLANISRICGHAVGRPH
jgi:pseudomonalisin/xanthomonalisin